MRVRSTLVLGLMTIGLLALPFSSRAQSPLPAADAAEFLGAWDLGLDTPQGPMTMELTLKDDGGKTVGSITAPPVAPDPQAITDISKESGSLVLKYTLFVQGMEVPAKITITKQGEKWTAHFDFAGGQFMVDGTATRKGQ